MKRLFVISSMLLIMLFLVWNVLYFADNIIFNTYNTISITATNSRENIADKDSVNQSLQLLAEEQDSLLIKRIIQPKLSERKSTFQLFGQGELPEEFTRATEEMEDISTVFSSYIIVEGEMTEEMLVNQFDELGYQANVIEKSSLLKLVLGYVASFDRLLFIMILFLTYLAMSVISQIKKLRFAGIRLISGEQISRIFLKNIYIDSIVISISVGTSAIIALIILYFNDLSHWQLLAFIGTGLVSFGFCLFLILIFVSGVYALILKESDLVPLIKGKLPVKRVLLIILLGQFLSVVAVGWGMSRIPALYQAVAELDAAAEAWDENEERVNLSHILGEAVRNLDHLVERADAWFPFIKESIESDNGLLVVNNEIEFLHQQVSDSGYTINDYVPIGNTLYVTPNYLDIQGIELDPSVEKSLNNLQLGQFGLLLPKLIAGDTDHFKVMYEDYLSMYSFDGMEVDSPKNYETQAIVGYLADNQTQFMFNHSVTVKQFVKDPIIVVITPTSMGDTLAAKVFWQNQLSRSLFFDGYDATTQRLKDFGLLHLVAGIPNSRQSYYERVTSVRDEFIILLAGFLISIFTSVLLFNSMNLLYFEEFRRDIFIKRIAGMRFWQLHQMYLKTLFTVVLGGFCASVFLTRNIWTSFLTLLLFAVNSTLLLYVKIRNENKTVITVLKGK